jgi:hypothetical protein
MKTNNFTVASLLSKYAYLLIFASPLNAVFYEPSYLCTVQFPIHFKEKTPIPARYKGVSLMIKEGSCSLPEDTGDIFYLLITPNIQPDKQKHTGVRLKRVLNQPCKWYAIRRNSTAEFNPHQKPWLITEETPEQFSEILPDNTLVVLMDPRFVSGLKLVRDLCSSNKHIPAIVLDKEANEDEFNKSAEMCHLGAIDSKALHCPLMIHKKKKEASYITLKA